MYRDFVSVCLFLISIRICLSRLYVNFRPSRFGSATPACYLLIASGPCCFDKEQTGPCMLPACTGGMPGVSVPSIYMQARGKSASYAKSGLSYVYVLCVWWSLSRSLSILHESDVSRKEPINSSEEKEESI